MRGESLDRIGDARLVKRLRELREAHAAVEHELGQAVREYKRRRVSLISQQKPIEGALTEVVLEHQERVDLERSEALADANAETDAMARKAGLIA
jgi:hypothetical protein